MWSREDRNRALRRGARLAAGLFLCGLPRALRGVVSETSTCGSPRQIVGNRDPWRCCGGARGRDRALRLPVTRLRPPTSDAYRKAAGRRMPKYAISLLHNPGEEPGSDIEPEE